MGWYQWQLFIVVGFGWANDNLWPIVTSLIRMFTRESEYSDLTLQCLPSSMSFIQVVNHILLWLKTHHPHHDDLGASSASLTRSTTPSYLPPNHQRRGIRRWLNIHHVPQLTYHRSCWVPRSSSRWGTRRDPEVRTERCSCRIYHFHRRLSVRHHDCADE